MTYLEEIKPYRQYIELYRQGKGSLSPKIKNELSDIYNNLRYKESVKIYGKQKAKNEIPLVDTGCSECIRIMVNGLTNWIREYEKLEPKKKLVNFKGVPDKAPEPTPTEREIPIDITKLSWGDFKKYCREERGLKVKGKKRVALMEELKLMNM